MITIQEALDLIAAEEVAKKSFKLRVSESLNYYLAEQLLAPFDLPSFDNSAMDGYAVQGGGPEFQMIGEIQAGDTSTYTLGSGQAFRIFTGAKIPDHCEAVIMQEKTRKEGNKVVVEDQIVLGKNIRRRGSQITKGSLVFAAGQKINPSVIGLLTSFGYEEVAVFSRPQINLITTGNELVQPGQPLKEGQLYEANSNTLRSTLTDLGFSSSHVHVSDDFESTRSIIQDQLKDSKILLISGGISVGDYDFVKKALEENGVEEIFYRIFQKPGKPLYFGKKGSTFVFGLPGNPASSLVCLYVYVIPLLRRMMGSEKTEPDWTWIPMASEYQMLFDRPSFLKAEITPDGLNILEGQGSSMLLSMAKGNAIAMVEPGSKLKPGDFVRCLLIN